MLKTADRQTIDAFEIWYRRPILRISWTAHSTNASLLKELQLGRTQTFVLRLSALCVTILSMVISRVEALKG